MKRIKFPGPKTMFRGTTGLIKTRIVKPGQRAVSGISANLGKNEYAVFVEPVVRRLRHRPTDGIAETVGPPGDFPQAEESPAESSLVDESFTRPVPAVDEPDEEPNGEHGGGQLETDEIIRDSESGSGPDDGPLDTGSETTSPVENTRVHPDNGPLMRTMVEAAPDSPAGEGELSGLLSEDLQDIFKTTNYTNPRTKALVRGREYVDVHELAKELDEYARSIGAVPATR